MYNHAIGGALSQVMSAKKHVDSTILKIFIKLSCDEHDRIFGLVSHFPQYISHKKIKTSILESYYASERVS